MKTILAVSFLLCVSLGFSQTLPEDFEMSITTSDFTDFDGGVATVLPNPQSSGMNTSATVGQIVRNGGQPWAGSKYSLASNIDFTSLSTIRMKVYTTAPIGTVVKFKLENTAGASVEADVQTSVTGAWEEMSWNFVGTPTSFNTIALMFDFGNIGNGSATSTFLFDDIIQVAPTVSQIDLPVTFEDPTVDYTMTDFGGNASLLVVDPTDPTNMVMEVEKTATAQFWAGTTISTPSGFASVIPITLTNSIMTARVWSPTSGTPIRLKVENAADPTQTCETEVLTTSASAWETLTFDFSNEVPGTAQLTTGISNGWIFNMASIFFNFGTDGATAGSQTYYFDDVMFGQVPTPLSQIDLPVTFEDANVDYTMADFGGNVSAMVVDPTDPGNTVMKVEKTASAQLWAGTTISTSAGLANAIPFSATATQMTVRVWSPTSGTPIRLKVEDPNNGAIACETEVMTSVASAWETLVFDFGTPVSGTPPLDISNTYAMASIFFNFGTDGATAGAQTYYFDDVMFGAPATPLDQIDLPVTFEGATVDYTMTNFGNNASTVITDPTNATNTVMEVVKPITGETWAGTSIGTTAGFATDIPFTSTETFISARVWSPTAGTPIRMKVENSSDSTQTCETEVLTTVAGNWETLVFDFSNEVTGTPTLSDGLGMGWTYDLASIFFNFGTNGATAGEQTYYLDDIMFGNPFAGINDLELAGLSVYPNPSAHQWIISSELAHIKYVKVFNLQGTSVLELVSDSDSIVIDASELSKGVYVTYVTTEKGTSVMRMVKK